MGLVRYTYEEAESSVARGEVVTTGGTGNVLRVLRQGRAVAIKRILYVTLTHPRAPHPRALPH